MIRLFRLPLLLSLFVSPLLFAEPLSEQQLGVFNQIMIKQSRVEGSFQQTKHLSILPMPIRSSGEFVFNQDSGLSWTVIKPVHSQMILDEQGIRQIQQGKVVWSLDASQPAATHISTIIASVLAADWQALNEHFSLSHTLQDKNWKIDLQPKSQVLLSAIKRIEMMGDLTLQTMTLFEANGDSTVIQFSINPSKS